MKLIVVTKIEDQVFVATTPQVSVLSVSDVSESVAVTCLLAKVREYIAGYGDAPVPWDADAKVEKSKGHIVRHITGPWPKKIAKSKPLAAPTKKEPSNG